MRTAPGVDLTQISAKSVRKSILAADTQLDPEWVRSNKQGIDDLIAQIFNTVSASQQADAQSQGQAKRKREDDSDTAAGPSSVPQSRPTSASQNHAVKKESRSEPPQTKQEVDDEEYARRISAELNASSRGRTTRGGSIHANGTATSSSGKKRKIGGSRSSKVKSPSKIVDSDMSGSEGYDDDDGDASDGGTASKRKPAKRKRAQGEGGGAKGGFGKEFILSEPLSAVCGGVTHLSRPQVVKALWVYIKVCISTPRLRHRPCMLTRSAYPLREINYRTHATNAKSSVTKR